MLAVLPAGARVDMKNQRHWTVPLPPLGEQRLEVFITHRVLRHPHIGELQEELFGEVACDDFFRHRREQRRGFAHGGIDERAAVGAGAAAARAALACDENGDGSGCEEKQGGPSRAP